MNSLYKLTIAGVFMLAAGCGGVENTVVEVKPVETPAKAMLESVAKSGELGSASMEIRDALEKLKTAGDAKGEELLTDLAELEKLTDAEAIKGKAQEMADKL